MSTMFTKIRCLPSEQVWHDKSIISKVKLVLYIAGSTLVKHDDLYIIQKSLPDRNILEITRQQSVHYSYIYINGSDADFPTVLLMLSYL